MRYRTRGAWVLLLLAATPGLFGCGGAAGVRGDARRDQRLLTSEEMATAGYSDAFSVVQALRPQWLSTRGTTSINQEEFIRVYMDDSLLGGPDQLRGIAVRSIASIRFLDGLEATNRWGLDHGLGAIVVSTRR